MRLFYLNPVRLFGNTFVRRSVGLAVLLFFSVPLGLSLAGCGKGTAVQYCNALDAGPVVGQVASISLSPTLATTGLSLNYGQIGTTLSASAKDCKGNSVAVKSFTYATSNMAIADINPATGSVCAGSWNRNTGGGIPDYTICTAVPRTAACIAAPTTPSCFTAYVTATGSGATSNAIPVYVHPVVTGVQLGAASNSCSVDPGTDCCPFITTGTPIVAPVYTGSSCISQGTTGQLVARVYQNGTNNPADNITCQVGHLTFAAQNSTNIVSIDQNGVATANQPGSTLITAAVANSATGSSAGFFSTCPPTHIALSLVGSSATSATVAVNNNQPLTAVVTDINNTVLTGLSLEFNSTTPQTIPAGSGSVTPAYPGTATITAACQPGTCNPSPFSQIGLYGNGQPLTSNGITITATGTSSTVLYMGSTGSQYVQPQDFTTNTQSAQLKLPYVPNSMVITQDGSEIYLGSPQGIMSIATTGNTVGAANQAVPGVVLSVSPSGGLVVVTDPVRQTISLYNPSGSTVTTSYGGVATRAAWSPDSNTVYITTTAGNLLTYSSFTNWQSTPLAGGDSLYTDVTVTVPSVGAYFAGNFTEGRSYCPSGVLTPTANPPATVTNTFAPLADENAATTDRLAATGDGRHILGAHAIPGGTSTLSDLNVTLPVTTQCPVPGTGTVTPGYFASTTVTAPIAGINAAAITGVVPSSNSALAFITYTPNAATGAGLLPAYAPRATGLGTLTLLPLGNGATAASAPVAGVFSNDNLTFFAGTSGSTGTSADNDVHQFSINGTTATETGVIQPNLPPATGNGVAPVNLLVERVKRSTS